MKLLLSNVTHDGTNVYNEMSARISRGEFDSFILIVPTRRKVNMLRREWLRASATHSAPPLPVFTLGDLIEKLAENAIPARFSVDEELQYTLLEDAARDTDLEYFRKRQRTLPPGTLTTILNTITKLKESGTYPVDLREKLEKLPARGNEKTRDMCTLYEAYEEKLGQTFRDTAGTLRELNEWILQNGIDKTFNETFVEWNNATSQRLIIVEGFSEFRKPECTFLSSLARLKDTGISVIADYAESNDALFGHLEEQLSRLKREGFPYISLLEARGESWRNTIQKYFFSARQIEKRSFSGVSIIAAQTRKDEAETIARIIKQRVMEKHNADLSKICVVTRLPQLYTSIFREAFADYGIPVNITDRFRLAEATVAVSFMALLDLPLQNYRRRDVARVFSSPYLTLRHSSRSGKIIDGGNLIALAEKLRIIGGLQAWREQIKQRFAVLQNAGESEDISEEDIRSGIKSCEKALDDLDALGEIVQGFTTQGTALDFKQRFRTLFDRCGTDANIFTNRFNDDGASFATVERESRAYKALRDLVDSVCDVLQRQRGEETMPLRDFVRHLRAAVTNGRYNVRQEFGKGVLITTPEETRGLDIDMMFIAGLVEGEFPLSYSPEIFLDKEFQTSRERHAQDERYLFYQAATNWKERLYLLHPVGDEAGKEFVRSSFIDNVTDLVQTEENTLQSNIIYSKKKYLQIAGEEFTLNSRKEIPENLGVETYERLLQSVNENTRVELSRHETHVLEHYEGYLDHELSQNQKEFLEQFNTRTFSASQLETFGKCPFRFFTERILGVKQQEETDEGLSPQERGTVLHNILYQFYIGIRERGEKFPQDMNDTEAEQAKQNLLALARRVVEGLNIEHPFWKLDIERYLGLRGTPGVLEKFIDLEHSQKDLAVRPSYFEVRFGAGSSFFRNSDNRLSSDEPVLFGMWSLRGKIDRIDSGENDWAIIDYKTGTPPPLAAIRKGISLQLPLYLRAVEMLRQNAESGADISAGVYYQLKDDCKTVPRIADKSRTDIAFRSKGAKAMPREAMDDLIDGVIADVNSYIADMTNGNFPLAAPAMRSNVCRWCPYENTCRMHDDSGAPTETETEINA
ncbi:MAG TPA: PD-(D/E)XK nuclease family protein [Candidatus Kapabacteria bacterium]|nr:PD-(D/E)XK nuclease family protein [Candidatus Kapabacteria bacterium]